MAQLLNVKTVSVPSFGKLPLADQGNSTFTPSGVKREHKPGRLAEDGGWVEGQQPAKLDLTLNLTPGVDVAGLNGIADEDVTVRLTDGQVHLMSLAFVADTLPVDTGTGKLTIMSNTSERIA